MNKDELTNAPFYQHAPPSAQAGMEVFFERVVAEAEANGRKMAVEEIEKIESAWYLQLDDETKPPVNVWDFIKQALTTTHD